MSIVGYFPLIFAGMMSNNTGFRGTGAEYYVVVIDAGSSGSRLHAYKFSLPTDRLNNPIIQLRDELYVATKPGLSSYTKNPREGAESIVKLIRKMDAFIPELKRKDTPLIVRATASLRSLPLSVAKKLIAHVRIAIANLGYRVNANSVKILSGSDQGINMWYTVNLLTANLGEADAIVSLEMGGFSAQVSFTVKPNDISKYSLNDLYVRPEVLNSTLFSHSFPGHGIAVARFGTLKLEAGNFRTKRFISVCVDPGPKKTKYEENFLGQIIQISGVSRMGYSPKEVYLRCQKYVKAYLMTTMINALRLSELNKVAAMGYYYHYANSEGLIPPGKSGTITIQEVLSHALSAKGGCATSDVRNPWRCFDAAFIVTLLRDGYGINENSVVYLYDGINGYSVDWSLGLAYNYIMTEITAKPSPDNMFHNYLRRILS